MMMITKLREREEAIKFTKNLSVQNFKKVHYFHPKSVTMAAMSTSVTMKSENPSICIPFVFPNITWQRVKGIFEEIGLGEVERVDMVRKTAKNGKPCQRAFVHFTKWGTSADATKFRTYILQGKQVKVVYDEPWFWLCSKSNVPRPERRQRAPAKRKHTPRAPPRIEAVSPPGGEKLTTEQMLAKMAKTIAEQERRIAALTIRIPTAAEECTRTIPDMAEGGGHATPVYDGYIPTIPPPLVRSHAVCCSPSSPMEMEIPDEDVKCARQLTFGDDTGSWGDAAVAAESEE
jgi:hypothetical protein